jgi:hypothetical protein
VAAALSHAALPLTRGNSHEVALPHPIVNRIEGTSANSAKMRKSLERKPSRFT